MRYLAPLMFFDIFSIDRINNIIITFAIINNQFFTSELILGNDLMALFQNRTSSLALI